MKSATWLIQKHFTELNFGFESIVIGQPKAKMCGLQSHGLSIYREKVGEWEFSCTNVIKNHFGVAFWT